MAQTFVGKVKVIERDGVWIVGVGNVEQDDEECGCDSDLFEETPKVSRLATFPIQDHGRSV